MRLIAIAILALMLVGCGSKVAITNYNTYWITGNENRVSQTVRTDSKPDIDATTNATATLPLTP